MALKPTGFWSYSSTDEAASNGRLSRLRQQIERELQLQVGRPKVEIFHDITSIPPGTDWNDVITAALENSSFFIPIITPAFLHSEVCAWEVKTFRDIMKKRGRHDLIVPIYYLDVDAHGVERRHEWHDPTILDFLLTKHWLDFRALRVRDPSTEPVTEWVAKTGKAIYATLSKPPSKPFTTSPEQNTQQDHPTPQPSVSVKPVRAPGTRFRDQPHFPEMVVISPGRFIMGSDKSGPHAEPGHNSDESPAHEVGIAAAFALGRLPVTRGEYAAFVKATGYDAGSDWQEPDFPQTDDHPVVGVSWIDAEAFIDWLNADLADKPYRLPTEAEWEYAARGQTVLGPRTEFATGARIEPNQAQYRWSESYAGSKTRSKGAPGTAVAGSFPGNAFGLRDMHGNVWEWTRDAYRDSYNGAPDDGSAMEFTHFEYRVLRGGSWIYKPRDLRSATRIEGKPSVRAPWLGVRVARTL